MIAVGIGSKIDEHELNIIANGDIRNVIGVKDFDRLVGKLNEMLDDACKEQ